LKEIGNGSSVHTISKASEKHYAKQREYFARWRLKKGKELGLYG